MSYCTTTDVQAINASHVFSASTKPTTTQVNTFIDMVAGELDAILSSRSLSVPVTSPESFVEYLKLVNAVGAAAMAESAMNPSANKGSSHATRLEARYQTMLSILRTEAISTILTLRPWSYASENTDDFPDATFPKDKSY